MFVFECHWTRWDFPWKIMLLNICTILLKDKKYAVFPQNRWNTQKHVLRDVSFLIRVVCGLENHMGIPRFPNGSLIHIYHGQSCNQDFLMGDDFLVLFAGSTVYIKV